ncbi:MAG: TonB-dependent receptor [Rikenellaceae bacterium]
MKKILTLLILLLLLPIFTFRLYAQSLKVNYYSQSLDKILFDISEFYDFHLSFDNEELSRHSATISGEYSSPASFLDVILSELPFGWELVDDVFVVYPKELLPPLPLVGQVVDKISGEPLPNAYVEVGEFATYSDDNGNFSIGHPLNDEFTLKASYLGYYKIDTLIQAGERVKINLTPDIIEIDEVEIQYYPVERTTQVGMKAGLITVTQQIASYMPGNGDDAIFNLLRVQPGVLASGEQSSELILWGSPDGTSRTYFDGIALWGLSNFSDNISTINPYMVSRIDLYRGGYDALQPDAAGGVANIRGKLGGVSQPTVGLFLNNETLNGMVELPIGKKSTLLAAYRQNYIDMLGSNDIKYYGQIKNLEDTISTTPDYKFRDYNIKYSFRGDNGDLFYLSSIYATDRLSYDLTYDSLFEKSDNTSVIRTIKQDANERNKQVGLSGYYGKRWINGLSTSLSASYSELQHGFNRNRTVSSDTLYLDEGSSSDEYAQNNIAEMSVKAQGQASIAQRHNLSFGAEAVANSSFIREDSLSTNFIWIEEQAVRYTIFAEDRFEISSPLSVSAGLRSTYFSGNNRQYLDPRLSLHYNPIENLKFNAAWGIYHQFTVETSLSNDGENYIYCWNIAGQNGAEVVEAQHFVLGAAYTPKEYIFTVDGYYKKFDGLTRYISWKNGSTIYYGQSKAMGVDFYGKRDFNNGSSFWLSYSLASSLERFDNYANYIYRRSPQDIRHEFKAAGIVRLGKFHLSATYIFGSGFPLYTDVAKNIYTEPDYNRLDISGTYSFQTKFFKSDIGLSILNVTDAQNIKYNNFSRIPYDQQTGINVESGSTPFTPLVYVKLAF